MPRCSLHNGLKKVDFVEDLEGQEEWPGKWDKLVIYYDVLDECRTLSNRLVRKALNYAMTTWDIEVDVTFKPLWFEQIKFRPDITIEFKSSDEDNYFKEKPSVLAYAYFPSQGSVDGKVVFNDDYIWSMDGKPIKSSKALENGWIENYTNPDSLLKTYNIIHVLIHELGHSLGLKHDVSGNRDGSDVMDAYYSNLLELSERDILRIVLKYPRRIFSRWEHYARIKKALYRIKRRF